MLNDNNISSNRRNLLFALICAVVLAFFAYTQVSTNTTNNNQKELEEEPMEEIDSDNLKILDYIDDSTKANIIKDTHTFVKNTKMSNKKEVNKEDNYYTLTFDTNGGKELDKQVLSTSEFTASVIPVRESWIFDGWFTDSLLTEPFIFGNVLEKDTTIYARWVKYVKFFDGDFCIKTITTSEDDAIDLPMSDELTDIIGDNYIVSWFYLKDDSSKVYVTDGIVLSDLESTKDTIMLYVEKNKLFDLSFYLDLDSDEFYHEQVTMNGDISFDKVNKKVIEINSDVDINTIGWYYYDINGNKCDFSVNRKFTSDITKLYLSDTYKIIYTEEKEDGLVKIDEQNVSKDSKLMDILEHNDKEKKEFEGWFIIENDVLTDSKLEEGMIINKDIIVVGKWKESDTSIFP